MVEDGYPPYLIFGAILLYAAAHPALITKAGGDETQDTSKAEEHTLTIRTDLPRRTETRELVIRPTVARFSPPPYFPKTLFFFCRKTVVFHEPRGELAWRPKNK